MALIKCPDCGKEFSDQATHCPNCGKPNSYVQQANPNGVTPNNGYNSYASTPHL